MEGARRHLSAKYRMYIQYIYIHSWTHYSMTLGKSERMICYSCPPVPVTRMSHTTHDRQVILLWLNSSSLTVSVNCRLSFDNPLFGSPGLQLLMHCLVFSVFNKHTLKVTQVSSGFHWNVVRDHILVSNVQFVSGHFVDKNNHLSPITQ